MAIRRTLPRLSSSRWRALGSTAFLKATPPVLPFWCISAAGSNYAVGDTVRVKYSVNVIESAGKVSQVDGNGGIVAVSVPSAKIIAYARSINQYPDLGVNWTAEVTSASSGVAATLPSNMSTASTFIS